MQRLIGIIYVLIAIKCFLSEGGEVVPVRVNGLINQSTLLSPSVDSSRSVQQVYWNFQTNWNSQTNIMASYINSDLSIIMDEFEGRLEILDNGRSLKIVQLRLEDSGLYTGTITFADKTKHVTSYNLTVYDSVPVPTIGVAEMKKNSEWCNVTLRCLTSTNTSALSYIWKYKHGNSSYQLYNNSGDTIQMSLQPESWDIEIMCIVQNPVDRKNVSVQKICWDYSGSDRKTTNAIQAHGYYALYAVLIVLVISMVVLGWYHVKMKKKRRKEETNPEEIQYAELRMTSSNESKQVPKEVRNPPEEPSEDIVYSTLRHGTD